MSGFDWFWIDILGNAWVALGAHRTPRGRGVTPGAVARLRARFYAEHPDLYGDHPTA